MAFFKGAAKEAQRAMQLQRQREKDRRDLELAKLRLESEMRIGEIKNKFAAHSGASFADQSLGTATVGLVTLDEIKRQQERMKRVAAAAAEAADGLSAAKKSAVQPEVQHRGGTLSFDFADDVDDEEAAAEEDAEAEDNCPDKNHDEREVDKDQDQHVEDKDQEQPDEDKDQEQPDEDNDLVEDDDKDPKKPAARRFGKDPGVDTWFLPDKDREAEERRLREELETEWLENQSRLKAEEMEVVFSYWDGSGHRRSVMVTKGMTIGQFLRRVLEQLRKEFQELRSVSEDQLMFIKEDTILPHHVAFIDLITSKARGKSGPLYLFDVKQDVRLTVDTALPSQETHAGKVCMRSWYDRNKHIFPACRWEPFDATKNWDLLPASLKTANVINVK